MSSSPSLVSALPSLRRTLRRFRPHVREQRRLLLLGSLALFAEVVLRLLEPWPLKYVLDAVVAAAGGDHQPTDQGDRGQSTGAHRDQVSVRRRLGTAPASRGVGPSSRSRCHPAAAIMAALSVHMARLGR